MQHSLRPYRTASRASIMASSDQGVGLFLHSSIPSRLHLPYKVPDGIPYSVAALCTVNWPDLMASRALSRSSGTQEVGAALNGAANRMPSLRAILYSVLLGIPETYEEIVLVRGDCLTYGSMNQKDQGSYYALHLPLIHNR